MTNVLALITVLSLLVAATTSFLAWTTGRDERRRTAVRVAGLARAIHGEDGDQPSPAGEPSKPAFARIAAIALSGLLTMSAVTGLAVAAGSGRNHGAPASRQPDSLDRPGDAPLALVALEHDRDDDRLIVRGIVRNAASSTAIRNLNTVVLTFTKEGSFIASRRAPVAAASLAPGAETAFVVALPDADAVDRYRVSFRTDDRIVPHIDRRRK